MTALSEPLSFPHALQPYAPTTDEDLIRLLDGYPEALLDINAYSYDQDDQVSLATGLKGRADGATMLREIKAGRLWVNLRDVETTMPDLWSAAMVAVQREAGARGVRAIKMSGQMILSSPQTRVPYHFDAASVILFHLRGRKRIYIYPTTDDFLPQVHMEQTIMRTTTEELPYSRAMDEAAWVRDLAPGEAITWPLYAPHRVENLGEFNVSLSVDYQTWPSRITRGAHFANGVLRRWGRSPAPMANTPVAARTALWLASLVMKRLGLAENRIKDYERSFEIGAVSQA